MSGFEHYEKATSEIEKEIEHKGAILGIDWNNENEVRALAQEALSHLPENLRRASSGPTDYKLMAKIDLFGLAGMMLKTMEESAETGVESHGGPAWKAFSRALWLASRNKDNAE